MRLSLHPLFPFGIDNGMKTKKKNREIQVIYDAPTTLGNGNSNVLATTIPLCAFSDHTLQQRARDSCFSHHIYKIDATYMLLCSLITVIFAHIIACYDSNEQRGLSRKVNSSLNFLSILFGDMQLLVHIIRVICICYCQIAAKCT